MTKPQSLTLDDLLEQYDVGEVDDYHIQVNGNKLQGLIGWFYVCNDDGINAYFATEQAAFRWRLAEINRIMNS